MPGLGSEAKIKDAIAIKGYDDLWFCVPVMNERNTDSIPTIHIILICGTDFFTQMKFSLITTI